jgi:hypothetical protein
MEKNNLKELLEERFNLLFPNDTILGVKLDGFSHSLAYQPKSKKDYEILSYSMYAPEMKFDKRVAALFSGIPHGKYQGNHQVFFWQNWGQDE